MPIDLVYLVIIALAIFKGYSKGFIIAVFSFGAIFIGLAAALKLSATVAVWLGKSTNIGERLLPVLAFAIILIGVAIITRAVAVIIEKALKFAMLGFINKLAGIILFAILYTILFSIVLFFADKISLIKKGTIADSYLYNFIQPWGPKAIAIFSEAVPWFKNMFLQLENFFSTAVGKSKSLTYNQNQYFSST